MNNIMIIFTDYNKNWGPILGDARNSFLLNIKVDIFKIFKIIMYNVILMLHNHFEFVS